MKTCITCKIEQGLENFSLRKTGKPQSECRICSAMRSNEWYWKNKERSLAKRKKHYEENREETLKKRAEFYWANHEEVRKRQNARNRTPEERVKANKRQRDWNRKNPERLRERQNRYDKQYPEKKLARQSVMWAIRLGYMKKPDKCESCQKEIKVEAHHKDYKRPLEVEWFCRLCHMKLHSKELYDCRSSEQYIQLHRTEDTPSNGIGEPISA